MNFAELDFWIFFALVFAVYGLLRHKAQNRFLLVASYVFYGMWDWRFCSLIAISTVVDFFVGKAIQTSDDDSKRKKLLWISMASNLGILGFFKYFNFFADSFTALTSTVGYTPGFFELKILLPVGISFYTFQTMSYTIDIYRRKLKPTNDFFDFALFVAFFPQLVAGPIERATNLLPNVSNPRTMSYDKFSRGAMLCLLGLVKKLAVADGVAPSVNAIFASAAPSGAEILIATWLFALQIYCDFSGYSDIARGVSKMLGFELMKNFKMPYFATNPQSFWHRWHISLSTWLRDYLYFSLGGNRGGQLKTYRNLMATMVLGGLWHGAAFNFILWGLYQGMMLCVHRFLTNRFPTVPFIRPSKFGLVKAIKLILFFQLVCYGWLLFRADSFSQITQFTGALLHLSPGQFTDLNIPRPPLGALAGIVLLFIHDLLEETSQTPKFYAPWARLLRTAAYGAFTYVILMSLANETSEFIYFQF